MGVAAKAEMAAEKLLKGGYDQRRQQIS